MTAQGIRTLVLRETIPRATDEKRVQERLVPDLPSGTVTFLFTDIEGSTARWERDRADMHAVTEHHLDLRHGG